MTESKNNFIAGEWLAGDNSIENRNPSDLSDIIGHFAQANSTQLDKALDDPTGQQLRRVQSASILRREQRRAAAVKSAIVAVSKPSPAGKTRDVAATAAAVLMLFVDEAALPVYLTMPLMLEAAHCEPSIRSQTNRPL